MNTKVVKTFSSSESDTFDVINEQGVVLAYYYVNYRDPISNKVLKEPVYDIYYDYDGEDDYDSSLITDNFDDIVDIIDSLE